MELTIGLALHALQASFDYHPLRTVDHDRHARDVWLGGDQIQERDHRLFAVEKAFIHVDVDDLRAAFNLLTGHGKGCRIIVGLDQFAKFCRACDVGALTDVDEGGT